jgi:hypothetical protein
MDYKSKFTKRKHFPPSKSENNENNEKKDNNDNNKTRAPQTIWS